MPLPAAAQHFLGFVAGCGLGALRKGCSSKMILAHEEQRGGNRACCRRRRRRLHAAPTRRAEVGGPPRPLHTHFPRAPAAGTIAYFYNHPEEAYFGDHTYIRWKSSRWDSERVAQVGGEWAAGAAARAAQAQQQGPPLQAGDASTLPGYMHAPQRLSCMHACMRYIRLGPWRSFRWVQVRQAASQSAVRERWTDPGQSA